MALYQVAAGNQAVIGDLNQYYNLFAGSDKSTIVNINGAINVSTMLLGNQDSASSLGNVDTTTRLVLAGTGVRAGILAYRPKATNGPLLYLTGLTAGYDDSQLNLAVNGRISSAIVGVSAKSLLNPVPIHPTASQVTNLTALANGANAAFTVNGLPSSAVMASVTVTLTAGTATTAAVDISALPADTTYPITTNLQTASQVSAVMYVTQGATNQLAYTVISNGTVNVNVVLNCYWEAA